MNLRNSLLALALSHIVSVIVLMVLFGSEQTSDSLRYITVANEFLEFSMTPGANCITAPGYPFFLATTKFITGYDKFIIAFLQALLFAASVSYLFSGLRKRAWLNGSQLILLSVLILFSPDFLHANAKTLTESLTTSLLILVTASLLRDMKSLGPKVILILSSTLLVVTKFEYLFVLPAVFFVLLKQRRFQVAFFLTMALTLTLAANGLKNKHLFQKFNPFSFGSGTVMYGGNNLNGDGSWHIIGQTEGYLLARYETEYNKLLALECNSACKCLARNSFFRGLAFDAWKSDPMDQVHVIPQKFGKLWLLPGGVDIYSEREKIIPGLRFSLLFDVKLWSTAGIVKNVVITGLHWVYLILILLGVTVRARSRKMGSEDLFVLYVFLVISGLYSIPFYGLSRFHVPVFALLIPYAAQGLAFAHTRLVPNSRSDKL